MSTRLLDAATRRRLIEQWRVTGSLLDAIRRAELAAMTPEESRQAAFDLAQLADQLPDDPAREHYSGLIEMQRRFVRLRDRGAR